MAFKIVLVLSLLGSVIAPPTPSIPQQVRDTNIIVGSSVSGPRTFNDNSGQADEPNFENNGIPTSDSGPLNQIFPASSDVGAAVASGSQGFSSSSGTGAGSGGFQSFSGSPTFQGPTVDDSLPGFGPFGGLGSVNSGSVNLFPGSAGTGGSGSIGSQALPSYEEHVFPRAGPVAVTETITKQVTKTHTLRVPVTSDVWVTSVTMVTVPVTQLSTQRRYVPGVAGTVTSVVRITKTPVSIVTRTVEVFPVKTMVSVFTTFKTAIKSVEFWQPIVHVATNYEVMTVPVLQTQTLLQRAFTTLTVTRSVDVTSTRPIFVPRSGPISFTRSRTYGYY